MLPALHEQVDRRHEDVEPEIKRQHTIDDAHSHQPLQWLFNFVDRLHDERNRRFRMFFTDRRQYTIKPLTRQAIGQYEPDVGAVIIINRFRRCYADHGECRELFAQRLHEALGKQVRIRYDQQSSIYMCNGVFLFCRII